MPIKKDMAYDNFFKFSPEMMFTAKFDGFFTEVNKSMTNILGWSKQEFTEIPFIEYVHPEDHNSVLEKVQMVHGGQNISDYQCRMKTKRGKWLWTQWSVVLSENGQLMCGIGRDCTNVKEGAYISEQVYDVIQRTAIVALTDLKGKITLVNERFCEISGYEESELIGKDHKILNSGFHDKLFFKNMWATIYKGKVWQGEIRNTRKDQSYYWVHTTIAPIRDSFGKIERFISIRFDITKEKEAQEAFVQSSKMSSLGLMSAGIAHEINNPLSIIIGKTHHLKDCIEDGTLTNDLLKRDIERINKTAERIETIVKGLSTFSRDGRNDPFLSSSLSSIIKNTLSFCEARLKNANIDVIQSDVDPNLNIECREAQMSQIFLNLIHNSLDAIEELPEKWIKIDLKDLGDKVKIVITDSGQGIPEAIQHKIMQPFFTTKEVGKGTGLGLSITMGLVKSHQGTLEVDRTNPNTSFIITLPKFQSDLTRKIS